MKRNEDGKIFIKALGNFEVVFDNISERDTNRKMQLNSLYEHIEVFTDQGQSIPAFKYYPSEDLNCFDKKEGPKSKTQLKESYPHIPESFAKSMEDYDPVQNCLGFCVLDGEYWINLTRETMDHILADDSYVEVSENYPEDHLVIYYINESPVHISKFNAALSQYEHKPGLNNPLYLDSADIDEFYQYSGIRYFRKEQPIQSNS